MIITTSARAIPSYTYRDQGNTVTWNYCLQQKSCMVSHTLGALKVVSVA